jgi:hypothetical protein
MEDQPLINPSIEMNRDKIRNIEITPEDKERFFKSILADAPYEEVVSLLDNGLRLKFRAMTVQENTDVVNQIVADRKNNTASETDAYLITISSYRLAVSLVSVNDQPFSTVTKDNFIALGENETYILARSKPMLGWPTLKLSAYLDAFQLFEAKVLKLSSEVQSTNFWKAST